MSENSERKGMVWARWRERLDWEPVEDETREREVERYATMLLDDERRALIRAAVSGYVDPEGLLSDYRIAEWSCNVADAVLARLDEEVRGE